MSTFEIRPANPADIPALQELFREYARSVGNEICFQTFAKEVAALPGAYAPPQGQILVATDTQTLAACVALRPLTPQICEMKRLYVRPAFRNTGLGRNLTENTLTLAATLGYTALRLDTLPQMTAAIALYRKLGFLEIPPYADNPASALCFEKLLKSV